MITFKLISESIFSPKVAFQRIVNFEVKLSVLIEALVFIALVNAILAPNSLADICAADLNGDNQLNVQDIVALVNLILSI